MKPSHDPLHESSCRVMRHLVSLSVVIAALLAHAAPAAAQLDKGTAQGLWENDFMQVLLEVAHGPGVRHAGFKPVWNFVSTLDHVSGKTRIELLTRAAKRIEVAARAGQPIAVRVTDRRLVLRTGPKRLCLTKHGRRVTISRSPLRRYHRPRSHTMHKP